MKLTLAQIQGYARRAGWPEEKIAIAAAIAYAESTGNTNSHNPVPPDDSYGLFQINMIGGLGPERRRIYGLNSNSDLYDPETNARVALGIYRTQGLNAWSTYSHKNYLRYMNASLQAYNNDTQSLPNGSNGASQNDDTTQIDDSLDTSQSENSGAGVLILALVAAWLIL